MKNQNLGMKDMEKGIKMLENKLKIEINGKIYDVPEWTESVVEDMFGNLIAIDKENPDMYDIGFARPGRVRRFKTKINYSVFVSDVQYDK